MKYFRLPALLLVCGLLFGASDARAQEQPAATPANLAELLPEGERPAMDFYLVMDMAGQGIGESMFMRWRVTPHEGGITVSMRTGGGEGFDQTQSTEHNADGKLVGCRSQMRFGDEFSTDVVGTVEGDQLVMVTRTKQNFQGVDGGVPEDQREVVDLKDFDDVVPTTWLPLAIGYHLREENPLFQVRMADYGERFGTQVMTFEDIGTEMMEVRGEKQEVHVLVGKMAFEAADDPDLQINVGEAENQVMHLRCLPSGEIVEMKVSMQGGGQEMNMTARSATAAEVRELFGDAAVDGPEGQGPPNQEAGE